LKWWKGREGKEVNLGSMQMRGEVIGVPRMAEYGDAQKSTAGSERPGIPGKQEALLGNQKKRSCRDTFNKCVPVHSEI
jgi:hypothetical protein